MKELRVVESTHVWVSLPDWGVADLGNPPGSKIHHQRIERNLFEPLKFDSKHPIFVRVVEFLCGHRERAKRVCRTLIRLANPVGGMSFLFSDQGPCRLTSNRHPQILSPLASPAAFEQKT
ncbi:hypothetical protein PGT21_007740 [Puccinia graminis f. sp. tritici]|uniref:Uncharacterized protein n=1 Tax=Puccinia graminis f. sp. tritici TaxID=56615 RepID=A0A5B0MK43_PUCGR|nr:hypothetical protein PGT21_007740 [Puccinia graminis f. sp. tritici]